MIAVRAPSRYDPADVDRSRGAVADAVTRLEQRSNVRYISADRGDADITLNAGKDREIQRFATALTANRIITLGSGFDGAVFRVVRTGLGAFTLNVGGLKTIPNSTAASVDVGSDGTAWYLTGYDLL